MAIRHHFGCDVVVFICARFVLSVFIIVVLKSWKSVKFEPKTPWKSVIKSRFLPWKSVFFVLYLLDYK